jgi:K+-transporting ATPase KdpF subunit
LLQLASYSFSREKKQDGSHGIQKKTQRRGGAEARSRIIMTLSMRVGKGKGMGTDTDTGTKNQFLNLFVHHMDFIIAGLISIGLLIYLGYTLAYPEKF